MTEVAEFFSDGVNAGVIVGAAICFFYKGRRWSMRVCGAASSDPTFALGPAELLKDELKHLIHQQGQAATTL